MAEDRRGAHLGNSGSASQTFDASGDQAGRNLILQKLRSQDLQKALPALDSQSLQESILRVFPPEMRAHGASVLEKMIRQQPDLSRARSGSSGDLGPGNMDLLRFGAATMRAPAPTQASRLLPQRSPSQAQRPAPETQRPESDLRHAKSDTCLAKPQDRELERRGASGPREEAPWAGEREQKGTSDCTTESDSEKDAVEPFRRRHPNHTGGVKRTANDISTEEPRKAAKIHHDRAFQPITSKAPAAAKTSHNPLLGSKMFPRPEHGHLRSQNLPSISQHNLDASQHIPGASQQNQSGQQKADKPSAEVLQHLTKLLAQQHNNSDRARSILQVSPFQDKPVSPRSGRDGEDQDKLRNCYSEGSAEKLRGEQPAAPVTTSAAIQHLLQPPQKQPGGPLSSQTSALLGPLLANPSLANYLVSGNPNLPGVKFQTVNSDVASDLNLDLSRVLGYPQRHHLAPMFVAKGNEKRSGWGDPLAGPEKAPSTAASLGASLGAFGSITPVCDQDTEALRDDAQGKVAHDKTVPERPKPNSGFAAVRPTPSQAQAVNPGFKHMAASKAPDASAGALPDGPDPRILDWVLGNRATIMNKPPATSVSAATENRSPSRPTAAPSLGLSGLNGSGPSLGFSAPKSSGASLGLSSSASTIPSMGLGGLKPDGSGSSSAFDPAGTLSRPRAIRASAPRAQESQIGSMDPKIEALMAKLQSSVIPHSAPLQLQSMPKVSQPASSLGVPNLVGNPPLIPLPKLHVDLPSTNTDIGRVVQWAGQELALRDSKVREAERQRDEERTVHDAAMSAVATEVMRIKAGQQELAKTHWNLQDMLSKKTAEAEDQKLMLNHLAACKEEISKELASLKKEFQLLKEDNARLRSALGQATGSEDVLSGRGSDQAKSNSSNKFSLGEKVTEKPEPLEHPPKGSSPIDPGGIDIPVTQESRPSQ